MSARADDDSIWVQFRQFFDRAYASDRTDEFRFIGDLGFGGKFWIDSRRGMWVNCYPEHGTPERLAIIEKTNEALAIVWGD